MLRLFSLNLEGGKHTERNLPYLKTNRHEVACFQEMPEEVFELYKKELGMEGVFAPMCQRESGSREGNAILAATPIQSTHQRHISSAGMSDVPVCLPDPLYRIYSVLFADVEWEGTLWRVATTHLPVPPIGDVTTDLQRSVFSKLDELLKKYDELILCGDFNAPRGSELFDSLAKILTDCIPLEYTTSIDGTLHRAGPLPYMVDGLFTTSHYKAHDVRLVSGLSDHSAVEASLVHL